MTPVRGHVHLAAGVSILGIEEVTIALFAVVGFLSVLLGVHLGAIATWMIP